jgi:hypothetical protein
MEKKVDGEKSSKRAFNLEQVGDVRLINKRLAEEAGFKCHHCNVSFTAYDAYLDHTNSKQHFKAAGIIEVERISDPERIRRYIERLWERKCQGDKNEEAFKRQGESFIEERLKQNEIELALRRKKKKRTKKAETEESEDEEAKLMANIMGISSFK